MCEMGQLLPCREDCYWRIVLKIVGLRKSRECRMFMISDAARLPRPDADVDDRFCAN